MRTRNKKYFHLVGQDLFLQVDLVPSGTRLSADSQIEAENLFNCDPGNSTEFAAGASLLWSMFYFEGYITNRYFMLKRWVDIVGQDYCYEILRTFQDFAGDDIICTKLGVKYGLGSRPTPRWTVFLKDGPIYTFSVGKYLLYIFIY